jgi:c-di-GMP-binding flagellar brake protein YcgR
MDELYQGQEKRTQKRLKVNCTVIYRVDESPTTRFVVSGKDIEARMVDISQNGMAMVTNFDIPVATRLSMRFALLKVDKEIVRFSGPTEITGEVRSNVPAEADGHRLGIYFTKMKKLTPAIE